MLMQNQINLYALLIEYSSGRRYLNLHCSIAETVEVIQAYVSDQNSSLEISGVEPFMKFPHTVKDIELHFGQLYSDDAEFYYTFEDDSSVSIFQIDFTAPPKFFEELSKTVTDENKELRRLLNVLLGIACPNFECAKCEYNNFCENRNFGETISDFNVAGIDKPFEITSVARADIGHIFDCAIAKSMTDLEMKTIASKMEDDYCDQLFWDSLKIITQHILDNRKSTNERCCRNCANLTADNTCNEGGFSEIGDIDKELTEDDCNAFTPINFETETVITKTEAQI